MRELSFSYCQVHQLADCPPPESAVLIYDVVLESLYPKWLQQFKYRLPLPAGEETKEVSNLPSLLIRLQSMDLPANPHFIGFGGGSICDLVGFIASVWKRGAKLTLIPSTWLSIIDSAHGGKTACNLAGIKNQIGTFYPAHQVYVVTEIIEQLGSKRAAEGWAEALKIALIDSSSLFLDLSTKKFIDSALLSRLIEAKLTIVKQDPFESQGLRRVLNLGHTLGHIIEAKLGLNHGLSVGYGLRFSYEWSKKLGILKSELELPGIPNRLDCIQILKQLGSVESYLSFDKKLDSDGLWFVFIESPGQVFSKKVAPSSFLAFANQLAQEAL